MSLKLVSFAVLYALIGESSGQIFGAASCTARCNSTFSLLDVIQQNCRCDAGCKTSDTCCGDYDDYCIPSCRRRCGQIYHPLLACQCNKNCQEDCCDDYESICLEGGAAASPTAARSTTPTTPSSTTARPTDRQRGYSYLSGREIVCPDGAAFVDCYINPCQTACPKNPEAACFVQECGVCEAKFFDTWGNRLDCYDPEKFCSDGRSIYDCGNIDLCEFAICPGIPRAICVPNRCGGCHYDFVDDKGNIIECDEAMNHIAPCKPGTRMRKCFPLPCSQETCFAHPNATCRNIVCGDCRAEFTNESGSVLDCKKPETSPCLNFSTCPYDPCNNSECPAYFDAECKVTQCSDCRASFYREGKMLRDVDCVIPNACHAEKASTCYRNPCLMYTCPGKEVICIAQYCDGCTALFFDMDGKKLTQDDCNRKSNILFALERATRYSQPAAPSKDSCPHGQIPIACENSPCDSATCDGIPNAFCGTDICNDCRPIYFDESGNQVDCKKTGGTCKDQCGMHSSGGRHSSGACQCTSDCKQRGDCCDDFEDLCTQ